MVSQRAGNVAAFLSFIIQLQAERRVGSIMNTTMTVRSPGYLRAGTITYGDLQAIFPFENEIVLCSVKGRELSSKFINSTNSNYFIYCGEYGNSIKNSIDCNATYYVITDTYSAQYAPNKLTVIESYGAKTFACDLLADYIRGGGMTNK